MLTVRSPGIAGRLFPWFVDRLLDWHFHTIKLDSPDLVPQGPLMVLANHIGWWDAFLVHRLNRDVLHRRYHVMMLEAELEKRKFFRRVGAFSWRKNDRNDALAGVSYAADLLGDPGSMLLVFPQGEIRSQYTPGAEFGSAPRWILRAAGPEVRVVFVSLLVDYGSNAKPTATVRWAFDDGTLSGISLRFNAFLAASVKRQVAP